MRLMLFIFLSVGNVNGHSTTATNNGELFSGMALNIMDGDGGREIDVLRTSNVSAETNASFEKRHQTPSRVNHDHINARRYSIFDINRKSKIDMELFEGDILLTKAQAETIFNVNEQIGRSNRTKRQAIRDRDGVKLWTDGVSYVFNNTLSRDVQKTFRKAAEQWTKDTCVEFRYEPHSTAKDRLIVQALEGCWSSLGKTGGVQQISLPDGCENAAAHEIGHTLGFYHTMSRHDRDKYVVVNLQNIQFSWRSQYAKQTLETNDNFNLDFDYGSVMNYGQSDGAINRQQPTLVPFDKNYRETLGSPFVSFIDVLMLNELYGCNKWCDGKATVTCENGGYPHPRHCWKCVCPGGYGGNRCTERPDAGCGGTVEASKDWQTLRDFLGDYSVHYYLENYIKCYYWIQSPEGTEIEVEFLNFTEGHDIDGCPYAGVEIKTNKKQQLTGYRFCSPSDTGTILRSYTNRVPIITWNVIYASETILRYRYVLANEPRTITVKPLTRSTSQNSSTMSAAPTPAIREQNRFEERSV